MDDSAGCWSAAAILAVAPHFTGAGEEFGKAGFGYDGGLLEPDTAFADIKTLEDCAIGVYFADITHVEVNGIFLCVETKAASLVAAVTE